MQFNECDGPIACNKTSSFNAEIRLSDSHDPIMSGPNPSFFYICLDFSETWYALTLSKPQVTSILITEGIALKLLKMEV